jgi:hypothetical protein
VLDGYAGQHRAGNDPVADRARGGCRAEGAAAIAARAARNAVLTRAGATIIPASPGFYHRPKEIAELVDFVVGRVLQHLGLEPTVGPRWRSGEPD